MGQPLYYIMWKEYEEAASLTVVRRLAVWLVGAVGDGAVGRNK